MGAGYVAAKAEFNNADGVNIGFSDPALTASEIPAGIFERASYGLDSGCSVADPSCTTCYLDGFEHSCGQVAHLLEIGAAAQCPNNDCGPLRVYNPATQQNEWRFFRAFADGYQGYVPLGATSSGGGGITLGNGNEGWGDLEFAHAPQNTSNPQITPCDRKFASIFGDSDAVARTAYDYNGRYRGLDPAARAAAAGLPRSDFSNPIWDAEHLYNFPHLSGNLAGTANADIYVPGNYTGQPTGPTKSDAVVTFFYKSFFFGVRIVTLAVFHVGNFGIERMVDGSVRIGSTGGPGGNTPGSSPNLHAHFELWKGRGYRPPGAGRDAARIPLTPVICK